MEVHNLAMHLCHYDDPSDHAVHAKTTILLFRFCDPYRCLYFDKKLRQWSLPFNVRTS